MNKEIIFQRELNGEVVETQKVTKGYGAYLWLNWIPFVGGIVFLIMTIVRKEFKAVWFNRAILQFCAGLVTGFMLFWGSEELLYLAVITIAIVIDILLAKSINYTKAYQLSIAGYKPTIVDSSDEDFIHEAIRRKKPWYQWIAFK